MALVVALVSAFALTATVTDAAPVNDTMAQRWVKITNTYRCMNGVGQVGWSTAAAFDAQAYVNTLSSLVHSDSYNQLPPAGPAGESLAMGHGSLEEVVADWYSEIKNCRSLPGCEPGIGKQTGHFTALVWKGVTQIGCAQNEQNNIYICRYRSGDTLGPWTANMPNAYRLSVKPATKTLGECELSASDSLDPYLADPKSMYPTTAGGQIAYWAVHQKELEKYIAGTIIGVVLVVCFCFWWKSRELKGGRKPFVGALSNQSPTKDEFINPGTVYPGGFE